VFVVYPSYSLKGTVTVNDANRVIAYGKRKLKNVFSGEDDYFRMIKAMEETKRGYAEHKARVEAEEIQKRREEMIKRFAEWWNGDRARPFE